MLVLDSADQIRLAKADKRKAGQEDRMAALVKEIQSNTISVRTDAGHDTSSLLEQLGRPLTSEEVQRRLKLCNSRLVFIRSPQYPELTGVYIEKDERTAAGSWEKRRVHVCGMESGIMPEFSVLHQTTKRVPNPELLAAMGDDKPFPRDGVKWVEVPTFQGETRGWRTVLIRLLHLQLITRFDVEKHFGWAPSRDSERWAELTQ